MAVLNWGKPGIEIKKEGTEVWKQLDTPVTDTTTLETEDGERVEAIEEGGGVVDTYQAKSKFKITFQLFEKKGSEKPIEDFDGVIKDNYAIRITPEDDTTSGYLMPKCSVAFQQTYNSKDGGRWAYTFTALVPSGGGKQLQIYQKEPVSQE